MKLQQTRRRTEQSRGKEKAAKAQKHHGTALSSITASIMEGEVLEHSLSPEETGKWSFWLFSALFTSGLDTEKETSYRKSLFFLTEPRKKGYLDSFFNTKTSISTSFFLLVLQFGFRRVCFGQWDTWKMSVLFERSITMKKSYMFFWVKCAIPTCQFVNGGALPTFDYQIFFNFQNNSQPGGC